MATKAAALRVLVATDGSAQARAAIAALVEFPWPVQTRVRAVIARQGRVHLTHSALLSALDRSADDAAARARGALARRWPDAEAVVVDKSPAEGVLSEAERFRADVIVVGWRGYGAVRRLLMGSVSRRRPGSEVRRPCRQTTAAARAEDRGRIRRISKRPSCGEVGRQVGGAPGWTGHAHQCRGIAGASLARPRVGGIRSTVAREVRRINTVRSKAAVKALNRAADELKRSGWRTRIELRTGEPLRELIAAVSTAQAQLLVVGARGTSGVRICSWGVSPKVSSTGAPFPSCLLAERTIAKQRADKP
jgi:nucleotide-binding universal stress UspA family protein